MAEMITIYEPDTPKKTGLGNLVREMMEEVHSSRSLTWPFLDPPDSWGHGIFKRVGKTKRKTEYNQTQGKPEQNPKNPPGIGKNSEAEGQHGSVRPFPWRFRAFLTEQWRRLPTGGLSMAEDVVVMAGYVPKQFSRLPKKAMLWVLTEGRGIGT